MSDIVWSDPEWLQYFPLNALTALDYFARSSFYDSTCNNEKLRQQGQDLSKLPTLPPGIEYVIHDTQEPHLYIIRKQQRSSPTVVAPLTFYYILDGRVYQAPTLQSSLTSRLSRCLFSVRAAFRRIQQDIDPLLQIKQEDEATLDTGLKPTANLTPQKQQTQDDRERANRIDAILHNVINTHASLLPEDAVKQEAVKAEESVQQKESV